MAKGFIESEACSTLFYFPCKHGKNPKQNGQGVLKIGIPVKNTSK
jgi:hypothetical protein